MVQSETLCEFQVPKIFHTLSHGRPEQDLHLSKRKTHKNRFFGKPNNRFSGFHHRKIAQRNFSLSQVLDVNIAFK